MSENKEETTPVKKAAPVENPPKQSFEADPKTGPFPRMGSFWERFAAFIIDLVIIVIINATIGMFFGFLSTATSSVLGSSGMFSGLINVLFSLSGIIVTYLYFGWFYTTKGQSIGKMVMNLKVVRTDNMGNMTWGGVFLRDVLGRILCSLVLYLGYLWYFMSDKRQCWNDSIANTYVVKVDEKGEILMDGPAEYPKQPVKTFLPCGCFGLLTVMLIVAIFGMIAYLISNVPGLLDDPALQNSGYGGNYEYDYQYDVDQETNPFEYFEDEEAELYRYDVDENSDVLQYKKQVN